MVLSLFLTCRLSTPVLKVRPEVLIRATSEAPNLGAFFFKDADLVGVRVKGVEIYSPRVTEKRRFTLYILMVYRCS